LTDLKVAYYYRKPSLYNFSIENVFGTIQGGLSDRVKFEKIVAASNFDLNLIFSNRPHADVYHITGAIHYAALGLPHWRTLVTVHDLGHLLNTLSGLRQYLYKKLFWDFPLRNVRYITTISDFTRNQLIAVFPEFKHNVITIYNPVSPFYSYSPPKREEKLTVMQIGAGTNKNVVRLITALEMCKCKVKLLLIRPFDHGLASMLTSKKIAFEFKSGLTQSQLAAAYQQCNVLFFASTYEGFGLPILEAMACGRPVITSNQPPMTEVAGDAAMLVSPTEPRQIAAAIDAIASSETLCDELIGKGLIRTKFFSASKIAHQYEQLYSEIANGK